MISGRKVKVPARRWFRQIEPLESKSLLAANVVINEIHYDPADSQSPSEFVELYNAGDAAADLSGWTLSDAVDFRFNAGSRLDPGGYAVVTQNVAEYVRLYGGVSGPQVAYVVPANTTGKQIFTGSLGMDFDVRESIRVDQLGAFDSGSNGLSRRITVELWSRNNGGTPSSPNDDTGGAVLTSLVFDGANPGELRGGSRFKALPEPMVLPAGSYTIVAHGYGFGEPLQNGGVAGTGTTTGGGGVLDFVGTSRWGATAGQFPTNVDAHVNQYGAGTFIYEAISSGPPAIAPSGEWIGKLDNDGERIVLRDGTGNVIDQVDYGVGFPWPAAARGGGSSIELIHPSLDNDLGGSWRSSGYAAFDVNDGGGGPRDTVFFGLNDNWRYFKGTSEPSSPMEAWRQSAFDDSTWLQGQGTFGYGETFITTALDDMMGNYSTVYFRRQFNVIDPTGFDSLVLAARYDDGINVWINGHYVTGQNVAMENVPFNGLSAGNLAEDHSDRQITLENHTSFLVPGTNVISVQLLNASLAGSSDAFFDARLFVGATTSGQASRPSPGRENESASLLAPPQIRKVEHTPKQPTADDDVLVTAKVTDPNGVGEVTLSYQIVAPGRYVPRSDPAYETGWHELAMNDDGSAGDAVAGDDLFSVLLPASLHEHRHLVRYRVTVSDANGTSITTPYKDDDQPNFAYFVYNGIPTWSGADRPGVTPVITYSTDVTMSLPAFHLISREADVLDSQFNTAYNTGDYRFEGTLVVDGEVYDHIHYRIRGQNSTYVAGKNKWKIRFNRTHYFQGYDEYGRAWPEKLQTLNFGTNASPWAPGNRGLAGMDEAIAFKLFAKAGVPSANIAPFQLRVIDNSVEASLSNQYEGDLWGLYLAFENPEKPFLDAHNLPDGNLFRMQAAATELENHGFGLPGNLSDVNQFTSASGYNRTPSQPVQWWRDNVDLESYYSFRSVLEVLNHNDIRDRENMLLFYNPETTKWSMLPWDVDLLYEEFDRWGPDGVQSTAAIEQFRKALVHSEINIEFQNRSRELQDLLLNDDQGWAFIEEYARYVEPFAAIDRAMWDYNPRARNAPANGQHYGAFYREVYTYPAGNGAAGQVRRAISPVGFEGMVNWVKEFISVDGFGGGQLAVLNNDPNIPSKPTITYTGSVGFPASDLRFSTTPFADPQGSGTFRAIEWRLGEVSDPAAPAFRADEPRRYEIDEVWQSGVATSFQSEISVPGSVVEAGHAYRARVRVQDTTGRWSHWSDPVQFIATEPLTSDLQRYLRVSEINYNPSGALASEFLELTNISTGTAATVLDLSGASITDGPSEPFVFPAGTVLRPGEYLLVVGSRSGFAAAYPGNNTVIAGEFVGRLSDGGETIRLQDADGGLVVEIQYADDGLWPTSADGLGATLELIDGPVPHAPSDRHYRWQGSLHVGGSPGAISSSPVGIVIQEVRANESGSDAIELRNMSSSPVDIGGFYLSNSKDNLLKFVIPSPTLLQPGNVVVFDESDFNPTPQSPAANHFYLNGATGGDVWLVATDNLGRVRRFIDEAHFGPMLTDRTWGRNVASGDRLVPLTRPTLGCVGENQFLVDDAYIRELMYHPSQPTAAALAIHPGLDSNDLEYLVVQASETLVSARVRGGISFDFPTDLAASRAYVVLSFDPNDPVNATKMAAFREHYRGRFNANVEFVGGYSGSLSNAADMIRLERRVLMSPGNPAVVSYVTVDEVVYDTIAPWPMNASGTGNSLVRTGSMFDGNNPANWVASPTSTELTNALGDFNGDLIVNDRDIDLLFDAIRWQSANRAYLLAGGTSPPTMTDVSYLVETVLQRHFGDANLDGAVDGIDFGVWQTNAFQGCKGWRTGDFTGDGAVDGADFNIWNTNKFATAANNASVAVPRVPRAPLATATQIQSVKSGTNSTIVTETTFLSPTNVMAKYPIVSPSRLANSGRRSGDGFAMREVILQRQMAKVAEQLEVPELDRCFATW